MKTNGLKTKQIRNQIKRREPMITAKIQAPHSKKTHKECDGLNKFVARSNNGVTEQAIIDCINVIIIPLCTFLFLVIFTNPYSIIDLRL